MSSDAKDVPVCADCEFYKRDWFFDEYPKCSNKNNVFDGERSIITGKSKSFYPDYCSIIRQDDVFPNLCGTRGQYFQPRKTFIQKLKSLFAKQVQQ